MEKHSTIKWTAFLVVTCLAAGGLSRTAITTLAAATVTNQSEAIAAGLIEDELIFEGWRYLYQSDRPIALWDGYETNGTQLAQFLVEHQIPVVWGSADICQGSSCSRLYCDSSDLCAYEDGLPGVDPIYINSGAREQMTGQVARVAVELAHEIFHRMQPFGAGRVTQLEEFWAFFVNTQVSGSPWPRFDGYDPLDPYQLHSWYTAHNMRDYLALEAYPERYQAVAIPIDEDQPAVIPVSGKAVAE